MGEKAKELLKLQFDKRLGLDPLKNIVGCSLFCVKRRQLLLLIASAILILSMLVGCRAGLGPNAGGGDVLQCG
jgi:hypothetical protein